MPVIRARAYRHDMPTVHRQGPYRLYFFSHEPNEPPHVHIDCGDATMKVWLADITIAKSRGFRRHAFGAILGIVAEHRDVLLEAWNEHFGSGNG